MSIPQIVRTQKLRVEKLKQICRILNRRGFHAEYHPIPERYLSGNGQLSGALIVQRLK